MSYSTNEDVQKVCAEERPYYLSPNLIGDAVHATLAAAVEDYVCVSELTMAQIGERLRNALTVEQAWQTLIRDWTPLHAIRVRDALRHYWSV